MLRVRVLDFLLMNETGCPNHQPADDARRMDGHAHFLLMEDTIILQCFSLFFSSIYNEKVVQQMEGGLSGIE